MQHTQPQKDEKSLGKTNSSTAPTSNPHIPATLSFSKEDRAATDVQLKEMASELAKLANITPDKAKRKIKFASLQSAIAAPGILQGAEVTLNSDTKQKNMTMELEPGLLRCEVTNDNGKHVVLVPLTNVKSMVVA